MTTSKSNDRENLLEELEPAFAEALRRLARYDRRNLMLLHRMRVFFGMALLAVALAVVLGGGTLFYAVKTNSDRISDIQQARQTSILFSCQQQIHAHFHTLVFLDKTELAQLHAKIGSPHYPAIERHTIAVLKRQPKAKRAMLLSNHKLLLAFIDNLAPYEDCAAKARLLTQGKVPSTSPGTGGS